MVVVPDTAEKNATLSVVELPILPKVIVWLPPSKVPLKPNKEIVDGIGAGLLHVISVVTFQYLLAYDDDPPSINVLNSVKSAELLMV
jgi:hypothetical protein